MRNKHSYDLNSLLLLGNVLICCIGVYLYSTTGGNQYVDVYTVLLLCMFGVQNLSILLYERKKRNPFIAVLMFVTLIYYMGRVITLLYDPWSVTLTQDSFTPNDMNYTLLFILLSNTAIFMGLILPAKKDKPIVNKISETRYPPPFLVVSILSFVIMIIFFGLLKFEFIGRVSGYITAYLININIVLLLTILYIVLNYKNISKIYLSILITVFVVYVISHTLMSSRSSILKVIMLLLFVSLAIENKIAITKKMMLLGAVIIPVVFLVFSLATFIRSSIPHTVGSITKERIEVLKDYEVHKKDLHVMLQPAFDRMGYLDYSADFIKNSNKYSEIINFPYYFKSIVDNTLTPGFDVFNTVKVAWAIPYVMGGLNMPTREDIIDTYQSNQITVYGEYYVLFGGYLSLLILFCVSCLFKKIYLSINSRDTFSHLLYRSVVIVFFYSWLNSFGIDWLFMELVTMFVSIYLLKNLYYVKKRKNYGGQRDKAPEPGGV